MPTELRPAPARPATALAVTGAAAVGIAVVLFGWLHVAGPSAQLDPATRTLSQYALLSNGWAFDTAVVLLAAGSLAVLGALLRTGLLRPGSGGATGLVLWSAGLAGVVWFEKHNWAVGPSVDGDIHRVASVVAFLSLPVAALLGARRWLRDPRWRGQARAVAVGGLLSLLCFAPIVWAFASMPYTGVAWWRAIPLGTVERLLGLAEVSTVLLMARWAARAGRLHT